MRLALLSNVTVELLAKMLEKHLEVYLCAGYDTWQQEMIFPESGLYTFKPEAVVVLLHANAYTNIWNHEEKGRRMIDEWCGAFRAITERLSGTPVFISSIDIADTGCIYGAEIRRGQYFENQLIKVIEKLHQEGRSIYILPVKDDVTDIGRSHFYSPKMWYMGSMPYSIKGLAAIQELILRYVTVTRGRKKKCIAVDLDNTLWGGVIGEDGVEGVQLSDNKEGARYKDTQRLLKKMKEQGVMLAILSKNNREDVEPVFLHPDMLLQHEDFVAEAINWEEKSRNIIKLAKDLNIGLDSFVFLDDNPAERERMKEECPEVAVLDFPKDTSLLPDVVAKAYEDYFLTLEVTKEDGQKTQMYRIEAKRKAEMGASISVEDFLRKLEMTMDVHIMKAEEEKRVTQLINKTNQFNVTTKRYSEEEVHRLGTGANSDIITVHMADKYGDNGLAAVLILKYEEDTAEIDTFLMSCRVMGRKAEDEILFRVKEMLMGKSIRRVRASYVKTAKNTPVLDLYDRLGMSVVSGSISEIGDSKTYEADIASLPDETGLFRTMKSGV